MLVLSKNIDNWISGYTYFGRNLVIFDFLGLFQRDNGRVHQNPTKKLAHLVETVIFWQFDPGIHVNTVAPFLPNFYYAMLLNLW